MVSHLSFVYFLVSLVLTISFIFLMTVKSLAARSYYIFILITCSFRLTIASGSLYIQITLKMMCFDAASDG